MASIYSGISVDDSRPSSAPLSSRYGLITPRMRPPSRPSQPRSSSTRTGSSRGATPRQDRGDLKVICEILKTKAQQKTDRSSQECFRYLDENEDGFVTRGECQRFFKGFGLAQPHAVADKAFSVLAEQRGASDDHAGVELRKFISTFGPAVQPGRYHCSPAMNKISGRGPGDYTAPPGNIANTLRLGSASTATGSARPGSDLRSSSYYSGTPESLSDAWAGAATSRRQGGAAAYAGSATEAMGARVLGNRVTTRLRPPLQNPGRDLPRGRANRGPSSSWYNHVGILTHDICQTGGISVADSMHVASPE
mmetsp:Transcript_55060/g.154902  ORF Transcript_55060/g.154902 Transcript_55060/m.154902 type:complete len:308 (-) Transcript_55060:133-1056(-)